MKMNGNLDRSIFTETGKMIIEYVVKAGLGKRGREVPIIIARDADIYIYVWTQKLINWKGICDYVST